MRLNILLLICLSLSVMSCGSSNYEKKDTSLEESLNEKNRTNISLLSRIRQLPGIATRSGVPIFVKTATDIQQGGSFEPLYVLNDYIVGNSFRSVNQLVTNAEVKKIETLTGPDAAFYGSRGANGVIKIITY